MPTQKGPARWAGPFSYASLAQSVEHAAVNRRVVGSSPTGGAKTVCEKSQTVLFYSGGALMCGISANRGKYKTIGGN